MTDFQKVDPQGWDYDLHSVYSAYLGHFQLHGLPWYERTWGHLFESFDAFLTFSWPAVVISDDRTGKAHIVTRRGSIGAFVKMIKTRFGDTLPAVDNMLSVCPFETSPRRLHTISDGTVYRKLYATLPATVLSAFKHRIRSGDPKSIKELWDKRDKTFLAIDFEWSERNPSSCLEWGYAAVRCGHLDAVNSWPPVPDTNYRKGHYIVSEYVDKVHNKQVPNHPWEYAWGDSQMVAKAKLPTVIQAVLSSLATPDSETVANTLVLVGHGIHGDLTRFEEMKIKLPHNVIIIDTAVYERTLFARGQRSPGATSGRAAGSTLSLSNLLRSVLPPASADHFALAAPAHNSGNDAFATLLALQLLLDPAQTAVPAPPPRARAAPVPALGQAGMGISQVQVAGYVPYQMGSAPSQVFYTGYASVNGPPPSPRRVEQAGYFDSPRRPAAAQSQSQSRQTLRPTLQGTGSRSSGRLGTAVPDEMGALRDMSAERVSVSMRNLRIG